MRFVTKCLISMAVAGTLIAGCSHKAMKEKEVAHQKMSKEAAEQKQQLEDLARQAYTFGFPLVLSQANGEVSGSKNWFDLSKGPVVISVPAAGKRFYVGTVFNAWADVVGVIGTRTTNNKSGNYVIVGPNWKGELPTNTSVISSPTNIAWFSTQIYNDGTAKDMAAARRLLSQFRVTQNTGGMDNEAISRSLASEEVSMAGQTHSDASDRVFAMDADTYYHLMCSLMVSNPPRANDADLLNKFQALGISPSNDFDFAKLNPVVQEALSASIENAKEFILAHPGDLSPSEPINGWVVHNNATDFGTDYDRRAYVAATALGTPRAQDEMIYNLYNDNLGQRLSSVYRYQVTFAKGQYPPTNSGWALFAEGAPTRAITGSRRLRKNADGSVTVYIQKDNPGKARVANWLPAPQGEFNVSLRLYSPKQNVIDMKWEPPTVEHVIETSPLVMEEKLTLNRKP